jgi:hypothetical protein
LPIVRMIPSTSPAATGRAHLGVEPVALHVRCAEDVADPVFAVVGRAQPHSLPCAVMASTTLPSLLRVALDWLEREYVTEGAGRDGIPSVDGWANLLRVLDLGGVDRRELPTLTRLSQRAVQGRVSAAARRGWVEELVSGRGQRFIRLTEKGAEVVARWEPIQRAAEDGWRGQVGSDRATALSTALATVVAAFPLEHPHYPASYGTVDASITGGPGRDWKPVPRKGGDTVA